MEQALDTAPATIKVKPPVIHKRRLALVIPGHNEELMIEQTIFSAIAAGQKPSDIFVVDDNSSDKTAALAVAILGFDNVLSVQRSGKAGAIDKAVKYFDITKRYRWVHIADADGYFGEGYFKTFRKVLHGTKAVAATGHVQSLPGGWISQYRTYEYTIGLEIIKRLQAWMGVITVIPGATAVFRSDIFSQLNFDTHSLTEDFDLTLQIHRRKMGKIIFIENAKCYTQDPENYHDYTVQLKRWYRGFWQGVKAHNLGLRPKKLDLYVNFILAETALFALEVLALPVIIGFSPNPALTAASIFLSDLLVFLGFVIFAASFNKRWDILNPFPFFYILRFTNLFVFVAAFFEVIVLGRFNVIKPGWETANRRYRIQTR